MRRPYVLGWVLSLLLISSLTTACGSSPDDSGAQTEATALPQVEAVVVATEAIVQEVVEVEVEVAATEEVAVEVVATPVVATLPETEPLPPLVVTVVDQDFAPLPGARVSVRETGLTYEADENGCVPVWDLPALDVVNLMAEMDEYLTAYRAVLLAPDGQPTAAFLTLVYEGKWWYYFALSVGAGQEEMPGGGYASAEQLVSDAPDEVEVRLIPLPATALPVTGDLLAESWFSSPTLMAFDVSLLTPEAEGKVALSFSLPFTLFQEQDLPEFQPGQVVLQSFDREALAWVDAGVGEWNREEGTLSLQLREFSRKRVIWRPIGKLVSDPAVDCYESPDRQSVRTERVVAGDSSDWKPPYGLVNLDDALPLTDLTKYTVLPNQREHTVVSKEDVQERSLRQFSAEVEEQFKATLGAEWGLFNYQVEALIGLKMGASRVHEAIQVSSESLTRSFAPNPERKYYVVPVPVGEVRQVRVYSLTSKADFDRRTAQGQTGRLLVRFAYTDGRREVRYYTLLGEHRVFYPKWISWAMVMEPGPGKEPLYVTGRSPAPNERDVDYRSGKIVLSFSQPLREESLAGAITFEPGASFDTELSKEGKVLTIIPRWELVPNLAYRVTVSQQVEANNGQRLVEPLSFWFFTAAPTYGPVTFASDFDAETQKPVNTGVTFSYGITHLYSSWPYDGVEEGSSYHCQWYRDGQPLFTGSDIFRMKTGFAWQWISNPDGKPLAPGTYEVVITIDETEVLRASCKVQGG